MYYIVVCKDDEGNYTLATRTAWTERGEAEHYAAAVAAGREAIVVECTRGIDFRVVVPLPKRAKQDILTQLTVQRLVALAKEEAE